MGVQVTLQLRGINVSDDAFVGLAESFTHGQLARNKGVDTLTVIAADEAAAPGVVEKAVEKLRHAADGARVARVSPGVVSVPELSALTGVDRETVRKWTKREDFPPLFDTLRGHKLWLWREVIDWVEHESGVVFGDRPPSTELERRLNSSF